jgi:hypothetical protein
VPWSLRFAEPIVLKDGSKLATLRDAIRHLAQIIPKAEHDMLEVLTASDLLTQAAEHDGPVEFSPENGNIPACGQRLSAISSPNGPNREPGDRLPIRKGPPLAGISRIHEGRISEHRTAWLEREDSNSRIPDRTQSLRAIRGIRELTSYIRCLNGNSISIRRGQPRAERAACAFRLSQQCRIQ